MKVNYPTSKEFNILGNFPKNYATKKIFRKFPQLLKLKAQSCDSGSHDFRHTRAGTGNFEMCGIKDVNIGWLKQNITHKIAIEFRIFFGPSCVHQMDFIVLVRDLGLPLKKKNSTIWFLTNFGSLNPNLHRIFFLVQGWFRNGPGVTRAGL
jgi:hypothetical protein